VPTLTTLLHGTRKPEFYPVNGRKKGEPWKLGLSRYSEMLAVGAIVVYFQSTPNFYTEDASRAGIRSAIGLRPEGSIALRCVGGWSRPCRPCDPGRACRRSALSFGVRSALRSQTQTWESPEAILAYVACEGGLLFSIFHRFGQIDDTEHAIQQHDPPRQCLRANRHD